MIKSNLGYTSIFFGPRWAWKTQQAVYDAYDAYINDWAIIISNIWLSFPHIRFTSWEMLSQIMQEIAEVNHKMTTPISAPSQFLKEYWMKRRKWKIQKFFILWDEIWKYLNSRNWQKNFKSTLLIDMLTEPRKYKLTIIWITQAWAMIDKQFRIMSSDWFLFTKRGWWIFERMVKRKYYVWDWEFSFETSLLQEEYSFFIRSNKILNKFRTFYFTDEIVGDWKMEWSPHIFTIWDIIRRCIPKKFQSKDHIVDEWEEFDTIRPVI